MQAFDRLLFRLTCAAWLSIAAAAGGVFYLRAQGVKAIAWRSPASHAIVWRIKL